MHFSNHTGYGEWRGPLLSADDLREVVRGVEERGVLARVAAVLSGYQGAEDVGEVVLETVARVKELNPAAIYCCDPVMGDVGRGMFVRPGIPELMRDRVVPAADVITPNHFELDFLAGRETRTLADVLAAVDDVRATGPSTVLVTSVLTDETPEGSVDVLAVSDEGAWRMPYAAAADLAQRRRRRHRRALPGPPARAPGRPRPRCSGSPRPSSASSRRPSPPAPARWPLVAAQDLIADPPARFEPTRLR